jgi:hypothetical protein
MPGGDAERVCNVSTRACLKRALFSRRDHGISIPGLLHHSLDGAVYWVRYFANERFHEELLTYEPVLRRAQRRDGAAPAVLEGSWSWTHGVIDLPNRDEHRFRWYEDNRYQILDPYTTLPNDPWYPRVRFNCDPVPPEWARTNFSPYRPYMVGTWVPGKLIDKDVIEFERKRIWWDGKKYPRVLVFDKDYNIKWALDGNPVEAPETQGYVYPWTRSRFLQCDPRNARVRVNVEIAPDDLIYGFYFYEELDLIYMKLDHQPLHGMFTGAPTRGIVNPR